MTPLCMSQRCQSLRCACHSGVNDSAEIFLNLHICTAVSMTPLNFFQNLHPCTAESMTTLCTSKRSQWLRCDKSRRLQSQFSRRILIHIEKGFNPCLRAIGGVVWRKKNRGRKSRVRVPLNTMPCFICTKLLIKHCKITNKKIRYKSTRLIIVHLITRLFVPSFPPNCAKSKLSTMFNILHFFPRLFVSNLQTKANNFNTVNSFILRCALGGVEFWIF
jgi:hypothetical protein